MFVDSSDQKFEQDGCTRLSNCGFGAEEAKVDFGPASTRRSDNKGGGYIYNPAAERQPRVQQLWVPLQQISKG